MAKVFNRDVRLTGWAALYVNEIKVIDESGNIDAPITTSAVTATTWVFSGAVSVASLASSGAVSGTAITGTSVAVTAGLTSSGATGAGIGYTTGAGWTVTQITNRSTGVTLSKLSGYIQTDTTSLAAGAAASFTVTNTAVAVGDVVVVAIRSGATTNQTHVNVTTVAAGSFAITVENNHASTAETGAILINYAVIKAVSA